MSWGSNGGLVSVVGGTGACLWASADRIVRGQVTGAAAHVVGFGFDRDDDTSQAGVGRDRLHGPIMCRHSSPSRSFVLAPLRALHLDRSHVGDVPRIHEGKSGSWSVATATRGTREGVDRRFGLGIGGWNERP